MWDEIPEYTRAKPIVSLASMQTSIVIMYNRVCSTWCAAFLQPYPLPMWQIIDWFWQSLTLTQLKQLSTGGSRALGWLSMFAKLHVSTNLTFCLQCWACWAQILMNALTYFTQHHQRWFAILHWVDAGTQANVSLSVAPLLTNTLECTTLIDGTATHLTTTATCFGWSVCIATFGRGWQAVSHWIMAYYFKMQCNMSSCKLER